MKANNAKAMREALLAIRKAMVLDSGNGTTTEFHSVVDTLTQAALAAPARNCDVGTPEEQAKRRMAFCRDHGCHLCPCYRYSSTTMLCDLRWAQMPYEEGEEK